MHINPFFKLTTLFLSLSLLLTPLPTLASTYSYDAFNRLSTVTDKNDTTTYIYGEGDDIVMKILPDGKRHYYYGPTTEKDPDGNWIHYIYLDPINFTNLIAIEDKNGTHTVISDHLGSPSLILDAQRYWNASDAERGRMLGHITEKIGEGYALGRVGVKILNSVKGGYINSVDFAEILNNENKFHHVFENPAHQLDLLGTPQEALQKASSALLQADTAGLIPQSGIYSITRTIEGNPVTIRGTVLDGVARIGTMFIKK